MLNDRRPQQMDRLLALFERNPMPNVYDVYIAARGRIFNGPPRLCAQHLGTTVTRFNRKAAPKRIVPGAEHYTYRLIEE